MDEGPELLEADAHDDDAPSVIAISLGPLTNDVGEVVDVVSDENPVLARGQFEDVIVVDAIQLPPRIESEDVVTSFPQTATDDPA